MSDDNSTPEVTVTTGGEGQTPTPPAQTFDAAYVKQLRDEAARYRTEKNSAVDAAKATVQQEWEGKVASATQRSADLESELGNAWIELEKLHTALALNVPSDKVLAFAEILKGTTQEEIKSSASSAKELFGGFQTADPATDPTQGSGGTNPLPLNGDPILEAISKMVGK